MVHPGGGVKEQTAGLYAGKLAEADFVAVAYDASHQDDTAYQAESILERAASAKKELYALKAQPTFLYMIKTQTRQ